MANSLYKVTPGQAQPPLASDINQYADVLNGAFDAGAITLAAPISPPSITGVSVALAAGAGLGIGAYVYRLTYVVGNKKSDNTVILGNETNGSAPISIATTSGNQRVNISGLPTSWPATAAALRIYRTTVGGADGAQRLVTTITMPATNYTDSVADGALGTNMPAVNGTGTTITAGTITTSGEIAAAPSNGNLRLKPSCGGNVGLTNAAASQWGLRVTDGTKPSTFTANNTLDDGSGNQTIFGWSKYDVTATQRHVSFWNASTELYGMWGVYGAGSTGQFGLYDWAKGKDIIRYNQSNGVITTTNNTLDDGTGAAIFNGGTGTIVRANANYNARFTTNSTTSQVGTANVGGYEFLNAGVWSGGMYGYGDGSVGLFSKSDGANPLLKISGTNRAVYTYSNTLDDGVGRAQFGSVQLSSNQINSVGSQELAVNYGNTGQLVHIYSTATIEGALTINGTGGSFANSKATNGYQKLPGGLIIQWGKQTIPANTANLTVNFPTAFPSYCASVTFGAVIAFGTTYASTINTNPATTTSFSLSNTNNGSNDVYWQAIGY